MTFAASGELAVIMSADFLIFKTTGHKEKIKMCISSVVGLTRFAIQSSAIGIIWLIIPLLYNCL